MNFGLVFVKHDQFYRETRLICPLYRSTEDNYAYLIGMYVFKRVLTCGTC